MTNKKEVYLLNKSYANGVQRLEMHIVFMNSWK
jgi:hypothetical protein